jgi:CubicO group peptidase (beta-lactamase class C family)
MCRRLLILVLLALAPVAFGARRRAVTPASFPSAAIDAIAADARATVPGLTIVVRKGNLLFSRGYGFTDAQAQIPARADSLYQIGSITKQFTAAAILRLVEQGKLTVDDPARRYLPELDTRFDAITIRHLLNHTSGVRDYNSQLESAWEPKTQQEIFALITNGPPYFPAGSQFLYSNSGYFLLGMIIERVSARTYEQFVAENFFAPLGLAGTSYCGASAPSPDGYFLLPNSSVTPIESAHMSLVYAAGAICSTAIDLARWNEALVSGRAVSPESYARMVNETVVMIPGLRYGFGLMVDRLDGRRRIWHDGSILGFMSYAAWFPDEDLTVVVLTNLTDLRRARATEIGEAVAKALAP